MLSCVLLNSRVDEAEDIAQKDKEGEHSDMAETEEWDQEEEDMAQRRETRDIRMFSVT